MNRSDDGLAPLRAMVQLLDDEGRETLARALHQHVHAPVSWAKRHVAELGLLARLLDEFPQPPQHLPYVERKTYDERRRANGSEAPRSEVLVERYGSWKRTCWAAWGLLNDGRKAMGGAPYPRHHPNRRRPRKYTLDEAIHSVCACTDALGRLPSSSDYHRWAIERKRRAREAGREVRIARMSIVLRLLAPQDARPREKWLFARDRALASRHT